MTKLTEQMIDDVITVGDRIDTELELCLQEGLPPFEVAAGALHSAFSFVLGSAPTYDEGWELIEQTVAFHRASIDEEEGDGV